MMKYKILATDMDGTLLTDGKTILEEDIEALRKAHKKGIEIVISTGRAYASLKPYLKLLGINCWIVTNNGSVIRDKTGDIIHVIYMKKEKLLEVITILEEEKIDYIGTDSMRMYFRSYRERIKSLSRYVEIKTLPLFLRWKHIIHILLVNDSHKRINFRRYINKGGKLSSLFIYSTDSTKLKRVKDRLSKVFDIGITSSNKDNIEILPPNTSKAAALQHICHMLSINKEEVIAVGDNLNDISMIEYAGLGVAMKNAEEELLKVADWITKSNEDGGISHLINRVLFGEATDSIQT